MEALSQRLNRLRDLLQAPDFLEGLGMSNEVNIRIFCYDPRDELLVRHFVRQLSETPSIADHVVICNLYQLFLRICEDLAILEDIPEMESAEGSAFLLEQLNSAIGSRAAVAAMHPQDFRPGNVLLITGVGEVFPFLRIHTFLETLQPEFPATPVLVLFPGQFENYHVRLFNRLEPHDYYRAFRVL